MVSYMCYICYIDMNETRLYLNRYNQTRYNIRTYVTSSTNSLIYIRIGNSSCYTVTSHVTTTSKINKNMLKMVFSTS